MNDKGAKYEKIARNFLEDKGVTLVAGNFFSRHGEIDIITIDEDYLCFVEVRYRAKNIMTAIESVDYKKAEKIRLTAQEFLEQNPQFENYPLRFDLLAISYDQQSQKYSIQHLKDFF